MQKKLESFFKHSSTHKPTSQTSNSDDLFDEINPQNHPQIRIKYTREALNSHQSTRCQPKNDGFIEEEAKAKKGELKVVGKKGKKRSYAQYHLELGQSDFLLHTCKVCGIKYAKGDDVDEKVHAAFHKNFTHGIPFKGWCRERVIEFEKGRVVLVLNDDPLAQRKKVQEVVQMMEIELGDGWIFHELCKVYLYISSQRIAGCMVVEPITTAHRVVSDSAGKSSDGALTKEAVSKPTTLQFGQICFRREVFRKGSSGRNSETLDSNVVGPLVCEEEAMPASCGVRAIWVTPSNRRKRIATHLLDAARRSFSPDCFLERSQLAFSQPTSEGKALALKYTGTGSFLVYKS